MVVDRRGRGERCILAAVSHADAALIHLGWLELCEHLRGLLRTKIARAALDDGLTIELGEGAAVSAGARRWAAARSVDPALVSARLDDLDALEVVLTRTSKSGGLAAALERLSDVTDAAQRASRGGALGAEDLLMIRDLLAAVDAFFGLLGEIEAMSGAGGAAPLAARAGRMARLGGLFSALDRAVAPGPEGSAIVQDQASPGLAKARQRVRELRGQLAKEAEKIMRRREIAEGLQDRFYTEREGRVVLPVRADAFGRGIGQGIIHGSSASGGTLFVEPTELIDANNGLRAAQMAAQAEERRVLAALAAAVGAAASELVIDQAEMVAIDELWARLRLSQAIGGLRPEVRAAEAAGSIEIVGGRHPLLLLAGVDVVPNDVALPRGAALVISGPNAGGKTVALKMVGLAVLMAQAGLRLPTARPAMVPLYREVVTDVGDDQSILANLSTFSAHIGHVREACAAAARDGAGTLVLLDEIAVGTDPGQGAALAEAILLHLSAAGATVVTTTHYERLKLLAGAQPGRFVNAAVGFDLGQMRPTFRLTLGVPGPSSAFAVARRLGLPEALLRYAEAQVEPATKALDALLAQVNHERASLAARAATMAAGEADLAARLAAVQAREEAALGSARARKLRAYDEAAAELRSLKQEAQALRRSLRRGEAEPAGAVEAEKRLRAEMAARQEPAPQAEGPAPENLAVGERVLLVALGREGEVVGVQGARVSVRIGGVRTSVDRSDVRRTQATAAAPTTMTKKIQRGRAEPVRRWASEGASRHFGGEAAAIERSADNCVDLRGERAEEALRRLDRFLDQAMLADQEVVMILHGHGSGALRLAVREHLSGLGFVRQCRGGLPAEGGDGVTVAWLG